MEDLSAPGGRRPGPGRCRGFVLLQPGGGRIALNRGIGAGAKAPWDGVLEMGHPGGDDLPFVYSGTLVVKGQGMARVLAIGLKTEMGQIGKVPAGH